MPKKTIHASFPTPSFSMVPETGENTSAMYISTDEPKELEKLIREIESTGSGIELLNLKFRIVFFLKKLHGVM